MILRTLVGSMVVISSTTTQIPSSKPADPILIVAGDIHADCKGTGDDRTAALAARMPGTVIVVGDMARSMGTATEYRDCYDASWGRLLDRTLAVAGNHDWASGGAPFLRYFATNLGRTSHPTYYAVDRGAWRLYVLDSNCEYVDCANEIRWLRYQLRTQPRACIAAFYHHPTYSSTWLNDGPSARTARFMQVLITAGAEVAVAAHRHGYERFRRVGGVRQFVVGTGGSPHWMPWGRPAPGSEVRIGNTWGVLKLSLHPDSYEWRFVDARGSVLDNGSTPCSP